MIFFCFRNLESQNERKFAFFSRGVGTVPDNKFADIQKLRLFRGAALGVGGGRLFQLIITVCVYVFVAQHTTALKFNGRFSCLLCSIHSCPVCETYFELEVCFLKFYIRTYQNSSNPECSGLRSRSKALRSHIFEVLAVCFPPPKGLD